MAVLEGLNKLPTSCSHEMRKGRGAFDGVKRQPIFLSDSCGCILQKGFLYMSKPVSLPLDRGRMQKQVQRSEQECETGCVGPPAVRFGKLLLQG
jgi:hypothetical protein